MHYMKQEKSHEYDKHIFLQKSCDSFVNIKNSTNFAAQSTLNYG